MDIRSVKAAFCSPVIPGILAVVLAAGVFFILLQPWKPKPGPLRIDLEDYPVYMKRGFTLAGISGPPADTVWDAVRLPGDKTPARVNLFMTAAEKRPFLSPGKSRDEEFAFLIPFMVNKEKMDLLRQNPPVFPGLNIAGIGDNWEIYLNGRLVQSQVDIDDQGQVRGHRTWRSVICQLDRNLFREGENYLGFRIIGSPSNNNTGFLYVSPYFIDDYRITGSHAADQAMLICSTVYVFVGLYHLLLFFMRKKERYNLYYALFSVAVSIYFLCRNSLIHTVFNNSGISTRIEFISLYWVLFLLGAFFEAMNFQRLKAPTKIYGLFYLFLTVSSCLFSVEYANDILYVWQMTSVVIFAYIFGYDVIYAFIRQVLETKKKIFDIVKGSGYKALGYGLLRTSQGNILVILLFLMATAVHDVFDAMFFHRGIVLTRYSFFFFNICSALILARQFASSYNQANQLNEILEARVKERTAALEELVEVAESASRAKSEFMATMSHEIRTPLNAIIGLSDIELRKNLNEDSFDTIKKIRGSSSILLGIINDILDISKIEAGSLDIISGEYETAELISDAVRLNMVRIGDKPLVFELKADETLPSKLLGDELRIKQILNNILSNAIKYTKEGRVELSVYMEGGQFLVCRVSDTGIGIRKEDIGRLFTEYSQLDAKANRKIEGTGLGLAITKMLLDLMDGVMEVESEYGKGSVFTVKIPQRITDPSPLGKDRAEILRHFGSFDKNTTVFNAAAAESGVRVLVVDDVDINLEVARGLMEPYGLTVDCVLSGREAIERIRRGEPRYNMVLMDHMMPEMDGIETVRIIRSEIGGEYARTVPIVALTANALAGNEEMFLEHGFNGFISKPIDIMRLDEALKKWTG
ncbi:MAG: response regulator [Treponema sp.]|nr:response regulator [Treponema sp.]